jgi:steroid delta-isomerase-like uncharacterized protein
MATEDSKALARRVFDDLLNDRHWERAAELFAPEHEFHDPSTPGAGRGPQGMQSVFSVYQSAFPDAHWLAEDQVGEGDKVVTRWSATGTQRADLPGIPATGQAVRVLGIWIHRFDDGKIVETWNYWDTLGMLQQLGVIPAPQQPPA